MLVCSHLLLHNSMPEIFHLRRTKSTNFKSDYKACPICAAAKSLFVFVPCETNDLISESLKPAFSSGFAAITQDVICIKNLLHFLSLDVVLIFRLNEVE